MRSSRREAIWLGCFGGLPFGVVMFATGDGYVGAAVRGLVFGGLMTLFQLWRVAHPRGPKGSVEGSLSDWQRVELRRGSHNQGE